MSASAAPASWVSVTSPTYVAGDYSTNYVTVTYDRQPGIYFKSFTVGITLRANYAIGSEFDACGVWTVPYDKYPVSYNGATMIRNSNMNGLAAGRSRYVSYSVYEMECFMSYGADDPVDVNPRMWYRVYPYDGTVTPSAASGSVKNGGSVTFTTPQCKWPTYWASSHSTCPMNTGQLWPDVLVTSSTTGWPDTPTYANAARTAYNSSRQNTSASLNLTADKTNFVKVRLASDNDTQNGKGRDVEYSDTINSYIFYPQNAPTASPVAGTYAAPQKAAFSGAKSGQVIRYTTDGSEPKADSPAYDEPIAVSNTTIKAQIYEGDIPMSPVGTYEYKVSVPAVTAEPGAGSYWNTQEIALSCAGGYELYYTLDGSAPTKETGAKYTAPIQMTDTAKLRVQRYYDGEPVGDVTNFDYVIQLPGVKANPSPGAVGKGTKVALSLANSDMEHTDIYYTENAALPYDRWMRYTSPIEITKDVTLSAVARDKISGRYGEKAIFTYQYSELGYTLNDLSFWNGSTKVTSTDISTLAGKTVTAKANITKIIPSIQGWLVTALHDPSGHAQQIKLDKLDQISGASRGDAVGKSVTLPADTTNYVLKTFIVHDFAQLRPVSAVVQIGEKAQE